LLIILVTFFSLVFHVLFRGIEGRYPYGGPNGTFADSAVHPSESSPARAQSVCHWGQPPSAEVARHQEEGNLAKCSVFVKGGAAGCKDYFRTLQDSWIELFILVTTANYPDVMLPVIDCSIWMALPFIIYVVAGLYFFMSLILAVAYVHFASESDARTSQFIFKRRKALVGAFHAIVHIQKQHAAQRSVELGQPRLRRAERAQPRLQPIVEAPPRLGRGVCVGQRRVGRLRRRNGIEMIRTRKYSIMTDSNHTVNIAPYLLGQDFSATGPRPEMGGRYVLYLDQRRVALSRCHSHSILGD
jgi:hypothetical protein